MARKPVLETAVMDILWQHGAWLTPREVRASLPAEHAVAYTTVMTVLVRLSTKGRVARRRRGRAFEYRAVETRDAYAAARMEESLASGANRAATLGQFLGSMTPEEQEQLRTMLDQL